MLALGVVAVGVPALVTFGCGPSCETVAPYDFKVCPADPNPNPSEVASCKAAQMSPCGGQYNDWVSCMVSNTKCDPMTKQSDPKSKLQARVDCAPKEQAYLSCMMTK